MSDETMTDILREGPMDTGNDTQPESSTETNETAQSTDSSTVDDKQDAKAEVPFNEHPRWKELQEKDKARDAELSELRKFREEAQPLIEKFKPQEEENTPAWWSGDAESYKQFEQDVIGRAKKEALLEIESKQSDLERKNREAQTYIDSSFSELENEMGQPVDRNKVMKFIADLAEKGTYLVDNQNRWAIKQAYSLMPKEAPDTSSLDAKKRAAAATMSESRAESPDKAYKVPRFMRKGLS